MQFIRLSAIFCALALVCAASAQWSDTKAVTPGGESTIATDGKGDVYLTCHIPSRLFASHDWGDTFAQEKEFQDAMCDMDVIAWPNGKINVSYIKNGISGFGSWYSSGDSIAQGSAVDGPLDREWLAPNLVNGDLYMDYSHGYIGGTAPFLGVYCAVSKNGGKTFTQISRIDNEPAGNLPVDPYLQTSSDGRIYAMWSTTRDKDTIDRFDFAYSTDGGHTFKGHQTLGALDKKLGDTQERWILGCITAHGPKEVLAIVPNYTKITINGTEYRPLLLYYRVSTDGGETFSPPELVTSHQELVQNILQFEATKGSDQNVGSYMQTLPWTCVDPSGRYYIAYQDNRDGQAQTKDGYFGKWHVSEAMLPSINGSFGPSEQVSHDVVCFRPPLDFLSCCADSRYLYISWTEKPDRSQTWEFTGTTYVGRKPIGSGS